MRSLQTGLLSDKKGVAAAVLLLLGGSLLVLLQHQPAAHGDPSSQVVADRLRGSKAGSGACGLDDEAVWQACPQWTPEQRSHWRAYQDSVLAQTAQVRQHAKCDTLLPAVLHQRSSCHSASLRCS